MAGLHFDITGDNSNLIRKLQETEQGVKNVSKAVEREGGNIEEIFERLTKAAAAFGVGLSAKEFIAQSVQIRGEFQKLEVAFTTMLGSTEKADALMQQMVRTAATTPFDLQGVANGAKSLLAYGVAAEDVNKTLIRLGDIAAGLSIPLGDLVYLYGTTMAQGRLYTADLNQFTGRGIEGERSSPVCQHCIYVACVVLPQQIRMRIIRLVYHTRRIIIVAFHSCRARCKGNPKIEPCPKPYGTHILAGIDIACRKYPENRCRGHFRAFAAYYHALFRRGGILF